MSELSTLDHAHAISRDVGTSHDVARRRATSRDIARRGHARPQATDPHPRTHLEKRASARLPQRGSCTPRPTCRRLSRRLHSARHPGLSPQGMQAGITTQHKQDNLNPESTLARSSDVPLSHSGGGSTPSAGEPTSHTVSGLYSRGVRLQTALLKLSDPYSLALRAIEGATPRPSAW